MSAAGTRRSTLVAVVVVVAGMVLTVAAVGGLFALVGVHSAMTSSDPHEIRVVQLVPGPAAK